MKINNKNGMIVRKKKSGIRNLFVAIGFLFYMFFMVFNSSKIMRVYTKTLAENYDLETARLPWEIMTVDKKDTDTAAIPSANITVLASLPNSFSMIEATDAVVANAKKSARADDEEDELPLFYVYDFADDIDWMSMSCNGRTNKKCSDRMEMEGAPKLCKKHSDDFWMYKHSLEHPNRTLDPSKAKLFFVGGFYNLLSERSKKGDTIGNCCVRKTNTSTTANVPSHVCSDDIVKLIESRLKESFWFQRHNGLDHVIVASEWNSQKYFRKFDDVIMSCNWIAFETNEFRKTNATDRPTLRMQIANTYVGNKCNTTSTNKTADIAFIGSMSQKKTERRKACQWLLHEQKEQNSNATTTKLQPEWSIKDCGRGKQCPALSEARTGLHVRGDTLGANRLVDTYLSDTVPVFTDMEQYSILPPFLPWREHMSIFAPINLTSDDPKGDFFLALEEARKNHAIERAETYNRKHDIRHKLDWTESNFLFEEYMKHFFRFVMEQQSETLGARFS